MQLVCNSPFCLHLVRVMNSLCTLCERKLACILHFHPIAISYSRTYSECIGRVKLIGTHFVLPALVPRLFSENSPQNKNKHQIMNVHTKWNRLIPILSSLVKH